MTEQTQAVSDAMRASSSYSFSFSVSFPFLLPQNLTSPGMSMGEYISQRIAQIPPPNQETGGISLKLLQIMGILGPL